MPEEDVIPRTRTPLTVASLSAMLYECGVVRGQTVLVHLAMSKLGWVVGGAEAIILALLDAVGAEGTIMMPAHSGGNTDPSNWQHPPVRASWWPIIREHMPAYNKRTTPTRGIGVVPELFRTWPGVLRSDHPVVSMAAYGPNAAFLVANHDLENDMGDKSPLARLYDLDGYVLLLGVDHSNNTSLHLAEYRATYPGKRSLRIGSAMLVEGRRRWVSYEVLDTQTDDFSAIGDAFDEVHDVEVRRINHADVRLFRQRPLVDFAVAWMERNRDFADR